MSMLLLGLILFLTVHSTSIISESWRDRQAAKFGEGPWRGLYSLASLAGFGLIVWGYGLARYDPVLLYLPPVWLRHITLLLLVPVFPLLLATYLPGRIQTAIQHPMLAATKLWAFAHLLANGMLADVLLFGTFLAWAVVARISIKRRLPHPVLSAPPSKWNDLIAVTGGLALYVAFVLWLHTWLIGVPPIGG
ncbi:MAG TPA: NnrU family protein [Candidatus Competibacteraceae bacterium]|nr:NnrU family protein [Candidatus Competibacteraceae bacterium]MCP5134342.1 NnrU family protein [Gammaproteobacteria bacterium]HPF59291.1 NnrU family protein [Candidatus Competibacteraceae bacterium]